MNWSTGIRFRASSEVTHPFDERHLQLSSLVKLRNLIFDYWKYDSFFSECDTVRRLTGREIERREQGGVKSSLQWEEPNVGGGGCGG